MLLCTVEGILFNVHGFSVTLYVPVPFNLGIKVVMMIDDCYMNYWIHHLPSPARSRKLNLYHETIIKMHEDSWETFTIHFANQTEDFPINKAIWSMAQINKYQHWVGSILIIKTDDIGKPINCSGKDSFYIAKVLEKCVKFKRDPKYITLIITDSYWQLRQNHHIIIHLLKSRTNDNKNSSSKIVKHKVNIG